MKIQPKLASLVLSVLIVGLTFTLFSLQTKYVKAQNEPIPGLWIPCSETRENEFHTLRPYQASNCGDYPTQALFCSNKLVIFENFQLSSECRDQRNWTTGSFDCEVDVYVEPHDLNITLEDSELPIMGNTQDELDDATKLNEYASWYLSGVESVGSTGETNDFRTVNYSGPLNKLLPQMVQESVRIETIRKATTIEEFTVLDENEQETTLSTAAFHDQYVVCGEVFKFLWIELGPFKPTDCYSGNEKLRIGDWDDDLSLFNNIVNRLGVDAWNKRYPPLPWDDGTVENPSEENPPVPFKNQKDYLKAYNEWRGQSCATIPFVDINVCIENPFVPNKWAELYPYIPMASNADSEGKNYLLTGDGPNYVESQGTTIEGAQHSSHTNPLLYFAHMQEVMGLSGLLNQTYWPQGYESEKIPATTEKLKKGISTTPIIPNDTLSSRDPYNALDCTAVNVRVNEGDDLFPGDRPSGKELFVGGVEYRITGVKCYEEYEDRSHLLCGPNLVPCRPLDTLRCHAQVGIEFKLGTKTPYGEEIFSQTVADSGSVFRRIFPKVEEGAPVECIADIPTQTGVTYSIDNPLHQEPVGGTQDFRQIAYPADGASGDTMLTFAHIGSVYEYFLKGIQTALRPKGFGEPIANGNCKPISGGTGACKQWLFEKDNAGTYYYDKVIVAASSTTCNGKQLNPFWAIGIALNENGGLMSDDVDGLSNSHFGCNMSQLQSIEDKISCMTNTLRNDCLAGKSDEATLQEYGYLPGYVLWPITVLDPGGTYPPPLFGSGFNTSQLITNLLNTDWKSTYASVAPIFCPNSPQLPR